eukprot:gene25270-32976_t
MASKHYLSKRFSTSSAFHQYASALFKPTYGAFIDGSETSVESVSKSPDTTFPVFAPATNEQLCHVIAADKHLTDIAIRNCHDTFVSGVWSRADVRYRAKILQQIADNLRKQIPVLAKLEVAQTGRAIREMNAQLGRLPEWFEYFAAVIRTHEGTVPPFLGPYVNYVRRVPLGVCGLLTPWNHPMLIAIKKIAPAIATGNSVV